MRFVQIYSGGHHNDANWDAHGDLEDNHELHAGETDQADCRLAAGSQAARPARPDADRLGRRVRPAADGRIRKGNRPRSQCLWLHDVDGRRRSSTAARASARPTNWAAPRSKIVSTSRHLHATILHQLGLDPESAHLLLQRPRPEAGRCRRSRADRTGHFVTQQNSINPEPVARSGRGGEWGVGQ